MNLTPEQIMEFFEGYHLHIGDGFDNCSGKDYDEMRIAAAELSALINQPEPTLINNTPEIHNHTELQ